MSDSQELAQEILDLQQQLADLRSEVNRVKVMVKVYHTGSDELFKTASEMFQGIQAALKIADVRLGLLEARDAKP